MRLSQFINRKYVAMAIFFSLLTGLDTIVIPTVVKEVTDAVQTSNPNKLIWVICFWNCWFFLFTTYPIFME